MTRVAPVTLLALALLFALAACRAADPPTRPEGLCVQACGERAKAKCTDTECRRGCRLSLDRLLEKEGDRVLACVAETKNGRCDDFAWASCATRVGVHADGGPPGPAPGKDDFDEDDK